jgi:beta-lactamase class D
VAADLRGGAPLPRALPCSTFKLPHALVALESGVIRLGRDRLRCDPRECHAAHGEPDLAQAIRESCVSYFRQTARAIGKPRMEAALARLGYPRAAFTWALDGFWLDGGGFTLSPEEQLAWIRRFYTEPLPAAPAHLDAVRRMSLRSARPAYTLHGKTGATQKGGYAWFLGQVTPSQGGAPWHAVVYIQGPGASGARRAQAILETLLEPAPDPAPAPILPSTQPAP